MGYKKISGIYLIRNLLNRKVYVGSSVSIKKRWLNHRKILKEGLHHNTHLQSSWKKYRENLFDFSIVELCSQEEFVDKESYWIRFYKSLDRAHGYNAVIPDSPKVYVKRIVKAKAQIQKVIVCIEIKTGVLQRRTRLDIEKDLGIPPKRVGRVLDYWISSSKKYLKRSYKGYLFIRSEEYIPDFDYINYHKSSKKRVKSNPLPRLKKIYKPVSEYNIKRIPIIAQNVETGQEQTFPSIENCINSLKLLPRRVYEALAKNFKVRSHRGFYFRKA